MTARTSESDATLPPGRALARARTIRSKMMAQLSMELESAYGSMTSRSEGRPVAWRKAPHMESGTRCKVAAVVRMYRLLEESSSNTT
jgi:hypothetical protein